MKKREKYLIPVNGKLYETSREVYEVYYKMDRRERYLDEVSLKKNISLEALVDSTYPVEERIYNAELSVEEQVFQSLMIDKLLESLSVLTDYEMWLIQELYLNGKSERQIGRENEIPRKTISYQKSKILKKLRGALEMG